MKNRIFSVLIISAFLFSSCGGTRTRSGENKDAKSKIIDQYVVTRIDSTLKSFVDSESVVGVSALIFEKNNEVYYNAFGYADREAKIPMARNTLVRIYSMTKPITGTALMTLYDKGAFNLDDPVSKYAPEFANIKVFIGMDTQGKPILEDLRRPMTIRDLTRHTAGFGTDTSISGLGEMIKNSDAMNWNNTLVQMAQKLGNTPLWFHPGDKWVYGPSVDVQAFLVERISGVSYYQYLKESVLDPLKMNQTRYYIPDKNQNRLAALYNRNKEGILTRVPDEEADSFNTQHWTLTPGGWGLTATIDDYMRFANMLVNKGTLDGNTILKPETIKLMSTNQLSDTVTDRMWLPSKGQVGFGIDFAVRLRPPATIEENNGIVGEFFWDGAASTLFWVDPVNELTAVLFVQLMPFDGVGLHKKFRDAVYGKYNPN